MYSILTMNEHDDIVGTEYFARNGTAAPHIVAFVGHDSLYLLVNVETGEVPFYTQFIQDLEKEIKTNYHE